MQKLLVGVRMANHNWTQQDDLKVLYITLYGYTNSYPTKADVAKSIGVSEGSLSYRIGNFKAIQGIGKATNYAKLSKVVYDNNHTKTQATLQSLASNLSSTKKKDKRVVIL